MNKTHGLKKTKKKKSIYLGFILSMHKWYKPDGRVFENRKVLTEKEISEKRFSK